MTRHARKAPGLESVNRGRGGTPAAQGQGENGGVSAPRQQPMRIGIMGGTFDPIHLGHLRAAEEIHLAFGLDRIIFVPAARPPHKEEGKVASALHRYEMVSLATVFTPSFSVSPIELKRPGKSYSIETVREFFRIYGPETRLYFILGVDAFLEIGTWKEARELLRLARLVVTARPGWRLDEVERAITPARQRLLGELRFKYLRVGEIDAERLAREYQPGLVLLVEVVSLDISSSEIRQLVAQGRSVHFLVPDTVAAYIEKNRLYQSLRRGRRRERGARGRDAAGPDGSMEAFEPLAP